MPHPWFQMLQDEEAEAAPEAAPEGGADAAAGGADVVFPDDYPNSVKHFLMLGAIGMLIGAIVFLCLNMLRTKRSTAHSVSLTVCCFFSTHSSLCSNAQHKTIDGEGGFGKRVTKGGWEPSTGKWI